MCHMSRATCHASHVMCCMLPVACHMLHVTKTTATDPPPTNFPEIHSRLVGKTQRPKQKFKTNNQRNNKNKKKTFRGMPILLRHSSTRSLQSTG